jgi:DNA-binding FrmR family transcriptional regulator
MARTTSSKRYSYTEQKDAILARLRRIEGQVGGVIRMVEDDRYCLDIVQQLTAITSGAEEVSLMLLEDHIKGCVTDAIQEQRGEAAVRELMMALRKAIKR